MCFSQENITGNVPIPYIVGGSKVVPGSKFATNMVNPSLFSTDLFKNIHI